MTRRRFALALPFVALLAACAGSRVPSPAAPRATDAAMSAEITDAAPPANQPAALDMPPPLHFSFWDQKRAWRFNGKPLSEEPPQSTTDSGRISHSYTWAFYQRLLDRAGLAEWGKTR